MRGPGGTAGGLGTFLVGPSLFDTLVMLGLLAAGLGLIARSLRATP